MIDCDLTHRIDGRLSETVWAEIQRHGLVTPHLGELANMPNFGPYWYYECMKIEIALHEALRWPNFSHQSSGS